MHGATIRFIYITWSLIAGDCKATYEENFRFLSLKTKTGYKDKNSEV